MPCYCDDKELFILKEKKIMSHKKSNNKKDRVLKGNKKKRLRIELLIPVLVIIIGSVFIINSKIKKGKYNKNNFK